MVVEMGAGDHESRLEEPLVAFDVDVGRAARLYDRVAWDDEPRALPRRHDDLSNPTRSEGAVGVAEGKAKGRRPRRGVDDRLDPVERHLALDAADSKEPARRSGEHLEIVGSRSGLHD
jgi:hypothetical protein